MSLLSHARVGDMVELKDFQSISDNEDNVIYTINKVSRVVLNDKPLFSLFELEYDQLRMFITLDTEAQEGEGYRLYYSPFPQLNRRDWVDEGGQWLFLPPSDPENFRFDELELASYPAVPELEELGEMKIIAYRLVGDAFFAEEQREKGDPVSLMLAEYTTDEQVLNPVMLLIERDWCDGRGQSYPSGGILTLMVGSHLAESEFLYHPTEVPVEKKKHWWRPST